LAEKDKAKATRVGLVDRIWGFFTSLRLVIILLLFLSLVSVAGTIIEQNKPLQDYYRLFRPETVELFIKLGLLDMYHSWWFTACLGLLALNIIACTMERYPAIIRGMSTRNVVLDEKLEAGLSNPARIKYNLPQERVEKRITALVTTSFPAAPVVTETQDARHFFYEKGKYTRLAFLLTHVSILIIFVGAIIGSLFGFKAYVNINEGEQITSVQTRQGANKALDFGVLCNSFNVEYYPNGAPKEYRSDLSVMRNGKEAARKTIRVNDPLTHEGITFYQSSFGTIPHTVTLVVRGKNGAALGTVVAPVGKHTEIPGDDLRIEVVDYQDHAHLPDGSEAGAAVGVNLYRPGASPRGVWLYESHPQLNRHWDYSFEIKGVELRKYTGLQVNKDPGVWVVWTGCIMMVVGIMMAFFTSHRKLWIRIGTDKKGRVELTAGGTTNKNKYAFSSEMTKLVERFREVS